MKFLKLLPNIITICRLIGVGIATNYLFKRNYNGAYLSFFIFYAVGFLDCIDGYVARKFDAVTKIGEILDPIVDKICIITLFLSFTFLDHISFLWVLPIITREVLVSITRIILLKRGVVIASEKSGKTKVFSQYISLTFIFLLYLNINYWHIGLKNFNSFLVVFSYGSLLLAIYLTISSGLDFFKKNWQNIRGNIQ